MHPDVQLRRRRSGPQEVSRVVATPRLLRALPLGELAAELGGELYTDRSARIEALARPEDAGRGAFAPVLRASAVDAARAAKARGAQLLVDASVAWRLEPAAIDWVHPNAAWVMAEILERGGVEVAAAAVAPSAIVHPTAIVHPGVTVGARVRIEAYAVVGGAGFGWAHGPDGRARAVPHVGGVVLDDDVFVGAHATIHAGVLAPTRIGARTKLDAHVHVAHNCEIGPDCFLAAQTGLAGSVVLGRGVLAGGQSGFADHVRVGDGARIAAKAGVIGDVPAGATYGGYPAVPRIQWLRGVAAAQRGRA